MAISEVESLRVSQAITAAADRHKKIFRKAWEQDFNKVLAYVKVVLKNNPGDFEKAMARPDVQYLLKKTAVDAYERSIPLLEKAALSGALLGNSVGKKAMKAMKMPVEKFEYEPSDVLKLLYADLEKLATDLPTNVSEAGKSGDVESVSNSLKKIALRASMIGEAAVNMNASDGLIQTMKNTGTKKMWKTTSVEPCKFCLALEGQIREWTEPFVLPLAFPLYGKKLMGPQLHPNCRCKLLVVAAGKD